MIGGDDGDWLQIVLSEREKARDYQSIINEGNGS